MALRKTKIPGSTLQETIIALTIVLICFSVALAVFTNVLYAEKAWVKLNADLLIKQVSSETKLNKSYYDEWIDIKQFHIEKTITEYNGNEQLLKLRIRVYSNQDKLINELNELVIDY